MDQKEFTEMLNTLNVFDYLTEKIVDYSKYTEQMVKDTIAFAKLFQNVKVKKGNDYALNVFYKEVKPPVSIIDFIKFIVDDLGGEMEEEVTIYGDSYLILNFPLFNWVSIIQIDSTDRYIIDIMVCDTIEEAQGYFAKDWLKN